MTFSVLLPVSVTLWFPLNHEGTKVARGGKGGPVRMRKKNFRHVNK
jgi:hypothetical protein